MLSCDCVEGDLLVVKAIYFFYFSGMSCIFPYLPVFMKQRGLLPSQIGVIKSAGKFMTVLIKPVLGGIADKTGRIRHVVFRIARGSNPTRGRAGTEGDAGFTVLYSIHVMAT
ncbi:MFSD6 [Branchiostoma lanceolatum]|uniref:MFSD6 protein n=1 Tax=Branchiostoma lanceolatum TaxID=7740 RepID=A0A8J9ZQJ4_BRALA|nr:MFSD6 [Branchiostoma lanceolatum]